MFNVQKVNPLYEQIYKNIKESIISGEFKPGERMIDAWIAEKLSVSRSPVREAFRKLEQDGLLVNQDGAIFVYKPNVDDVIELFEVRAGLESMAVFLATKLMSDEQIEELGQYFSLIDKAMKEKNLSEVVNLNTYFHEFVVTASRNMKLLEMMSKINHLTLLYRNNFFTKYYEKEDFYNEHYEIWKALKSRNAELASRKMKQHILNDLDQLKAKLSVQPNV